MNSKIIAALLAMTALLAGCTSLQDENEQTIPNPYPEEVLETGELDGDEAEPANETSSSNEPPQNAPPAAPGGRAYMPIVLEPHVDCVQRPNTMLYAPAYGSEWWVWMGDRTDVYVDYYVERQPVTQEGNRGYAQLQFDDVAYYSGGVPAWRPLTVHGAEFCFLLAPNVDEQVTVYVTLVPSQKG